MGRQPTSGYCLTCRARRVKCDRAKPTCQRCISSGHVCRGYGLSLRMRNHTVGQDEKGNLQMTKIHMPTCGKSVFASPPEELSLIAFQDQIAISYFFDNYPWAPLWQPLIRISQYSEFYGGPNQTALLSMALGFMGNMHQDQCLQTRSKMFFGQTLRQVQELMEGAPKADLAKLVATIALIGMYGFAVEVDLGHAHHTGILELMKFCGPEPFQTEPLMEFYRSCRLALICQCFHMYQRSFLEECQWKSVPWQYLPKGPFDQLCDIFSDLPGFAVDIALQEMGGPDVSGRIQEAWFALLAWRLDWEETNPHAIQNDDITRLRMEMANGQTSLPEMLWMDLEFENLSQAHQILTYNAALLHLARFGAPIFPDPECKRDVNRMPLTADELADVRREAQRADGGLLLPGAMVHPCQATIEATRALRYIVKQMRSNPGGKVSMVTFSQADIVYWNLLGQPELQTELDALSVDIPIYRNGSSGFREF